MMFSEAYSARRESKVVNDPGPAIRGKAIGIMDEPPSPVLNLIKVNLNQVIENQYFTI